MISQSSRVRIPEAVEEKLREVRQTRDRVHAAMVAVIGLFALLLAMSLAMFVDWKVVLFDPFWRSTLTLTALGVAVIAMIASGVVLWRRGRRLTAIAREVDQAVPRIEERWWTVTEIAAAPLEQQRDLNSAMMNRLAQESTRFEMEVSPDDVVSMKGPVSMLLASSLFVLLLLVACLLDWQQTSTLVKRFWAPTANISMTRLEVPEAELVVARGEPLTLEIRQDGRLAEHGELLVRNADGLTEEATMLSPIRPEKNRFMHRIKAADQSFRYRMRAGDGQSQWADVLVAERPELAAVRFHVVPPAYTRRESVDLMEFPSRIRIVEGSTLTISLLPRGTVPNVELQFAENTRQRLIADKDGWHHFQTTLEQSQTITALLTGEHGLQNKRPPECRIDVHRDRPPSVKIVSPTEDMAARPDDEVEIAFSATDDFGISKAELVIFGTGAEGQIEAEVKHVIHIPLGETAGAATISRSVPLDLSQFDLEDGQALAFAVRVYDTREAVTTSGPPRDVGPAGDMLEPIPGDAVASVTDYQTGEGPAAGNVKQSPTAKSPPTPLPAPATRPSTQPTQSTPPGTANRATPPVSAPKTAKPAADPGARSTAPERSGEETPPATPAPPSSSSPAANPSVPQPSEPTRLARTNPDPGTSKGARPPSEQTPSSTPSTPSTPPSPDPPSADPAPNQAPATSNPPENGGSQTGTPPPPNEMPSRELDVAQSASSNRMRLNIDQWAGSFAGRQRQKLEMMISPRMEELDQILARAENRLQEVLRVLERDAEWNGEQDRVLNEAEQQLTRAVQLVADLNTKATGTMYAFVGLQLSEIAESHIVPANDSTWMARQADQNAARKPLVESAWQQTGRARQRLAQLASQYERIRREHHLADAIEQIKTMYQVFLEDSFALLDQTKLPINNYQRRMAEFEVDEEYLERLKEILEMRQKLIAEFARILAEDPRLLRRFVDSINSQRDSLRDQLTLLGIRQQELDEELRTWAQLPDRVRDQASSAIIQRHLQESIEIADEAAKLQERFNTWLPLDVGLQDNDLVEVTDQLGNVATAGHQLEAKAAAWRPPASAPPEAEPGDAEGAPTEPDPPGTSLEEIAEAGMKLYEELGTLDNRLLELSGKSNAGELANFVVRRLGENRRLIARTSGWVVQVNHLSTGDYPAAAAVDQQQLAEETNSLTAQLGDLEQQLVGILGREDGTLPPEIAELTRQLFATLEGQIESSQLGAVFALQRNKIPTAAERTHDAALGFQQAEEIFDELFKRVIDEADKLPVQDPIADLLNDPTLDDLLALLESERDLAAALGIPQRLTNLQVMSDWLRRGVGNGGGIGGNSLMAMLSRQQQLLNRQSKRAVDRASVESDKASRRPARRIEEWNVLASQLEKKLLQGRGQLPPEQYRRAIEQYFEELSRRSAEETQSP